MAWTYLVKGCVECEYAYKVFRGWQPLNQDFLSPSKHDGQPICIECEQYRDREATAEQFDRDFNGEQVH